MGQDEARDERVARDVGQNVAYLQAFRRAPKAYLLIAVDPPRYTLLDATDAYLRMVGVNREELVGMPAFEAFPDVAESGSVQETETLRRAFERVVRTGKTSSVGTLRYDIRPRGEAGTQERHWSVRNQPVFDAAGELVHIMLCLEDVTDLIFRNAYGGAANRETSRPYRVLVVEPDEDQREFVMGTLAPHWQLDVVRRADEAMAAIEKRAPDAVVTSERLPDGSGMELVEEIKERWGPEMAALVRLEQLDTRMYRTAFEAGADDVIVGGFNGRDYVSQTQAQLASVALGRLLREQTEQEYRNLFMAAPSGIALLEGPEHVYTLSNPAHDAIAGQRSLIGQPVREALPELEGQELFEHLDRVYESGEPYYAREQPFWVYNSERDEEELRFCTFAHLPYRGLDGEVEGVAAFVYDVTELVSARRRAEKLASQARRESECKDEFLAMLGHELRNPLAPIVNAAEVLSHTDDEETVEWAGRTIARQAAQLKRLVNDLLDVSRVNQGRVALETTRCRLSDIVEMAVEGTRAGIDEKRQVMSVATPLEPVTVEVDRDRMTQVLSNLLDNASKYTPEAGQIWLEIDVEGRDLSVEVRDDGRGIEFDQLDRIFELFNRAGDDPTESGGGLGVGLALVRQIVEMHGGTIGAASDGPDRGSRFVVEIPGAVVSRGGEAWDGESRDGDFTPRPAPSQRNGGAPS